MAKHKSALQNIMHVAYHKTGHVCSLCLIVAVETVLYSHPRPAGQYNREKVK